MHGLADACSDDALWLVSSLVEYIKETGEFDFADMQLTYADGGEGTVYEPVSYTHLDFLGKPELFKSIYVWTGVWQGMGWSSIIYISALSGVDYQLHEAAIVDGANKLQRILHVDLPSIKPTIVMLLILQMGSLMSVGFEKVFLLQNTLNKQAASVISTYVYEVGLINSDYGYSTAIGLFNSVINMILIVAANQICKKFTEESLF